MVYDLNVCEFGKFFIFISIYSEKTFLVWLDNVSQLISRSVKVFVL